MGKRRQARGNVENIAPQEGRLLLDINSLHQDYNNMKTRSGRAQLVSEGSRIPPAPNADEYPTAVLLQDLANTASNSQIVEIEIPYDISAGSTSRSPLSETNSNEHTPEKRVHVVEYSPRVVELIGATTQATPTANLKILCDAVDHDETISSESSMVRTITGAEPVTPTTNLKMLITAASPEIRSLELSKSRLFTDDDDEDDDDQVLDDGESGKKSSKAAAAATRKQKSLGILCRR